MLYSRFCRNRCGIRLDLLGVAVFYLVFDVIQHPERLVSHHFFPFFMVYGVGHENISSLVYIHDDGAITPKSSILDILV